MRGITKSFPGVKALDNVEMRVEKGTVHALMGENGAGKSTLMKILFGQQPGEALRSFSAQQKRLPDEGGLAFAVRLMHTLYGCMRYTPGVTTVQTTAEQAFAAGAGVCQDYAHILLSLCRIEHIPCRYVVGLLLGEGASHAWTEIWDSGRWYALDPTNDLIVDDQHIKISSGRDYQNCIINQGLFIGQARQEQQVCASVLEQQ